MLQLGRTPSHLSLRFRHIIQARRFGLGTLELSGTESRMLTLLSAPGLRPRWPLLSLLDEPLSSDEPAMVVGGGLCKCQSQVTAKTGC